MFGCDLFSGTTKNATTPTRRRRQRARLTLDTVSTLHTPATHSGKEQQHHQDHLVHGNRRGELIMTNKSTNSTTAASTNGSGDTTTVTTASTTATRQKPHGGCENRPPTWKIWWTAARPHTLTASFIPCLVGYALCAEAGQPPSTQS